MYTKTIPFQDYKGKPRNMEVNFNLDEREVFKLLVEFQAIFGWRERALKDPDGITPTEDAVEFFNNLETILLAAWGEPSADGLHFRKGGRYDFEESALFSACMNLFFDDLAEANKLIDGLMPKGLQQMIEKADANLAEMAKNPDMDTDLKAEIERLRAQVNESKQAS